MAVLFVSLGWFVTCTIVVVIVRFARSLSARQWPDWRRRHERIRLESLRLNCGEKTPKSAHVLVLPFFCRGYYPANHVQLVRLDM